MTSNFNYFSSPTPYVNEDLPNEFVRKLQNDELTKEDSSNFLIEYLSHAIQTIPSFKSIYPSVIKSSKEFLQSKFQHFNTLTPLHAIDVETSEVKDQIPTGNDELEKFIEELDEKYIFDFITKIQRMDIDREIVFPCLIRKCNDSNYILNKLVLIKLLLEKNVDFQINSRQFKTFNYSENQIGSIFDIIDHKEINNELQLLLKDKKSCHITDFGEDRDYILLLFNNELMIFDVRENNLIKKENNIDLKEKICEQLVEAYVYGDELRFISISSTSYYSTKDLNKFEKKRLGNVSYSKHDLLRVQDDKLFVYSDDKITSTKISDKSYDSPTHYYYFDDSFAINNVVHRILFNNGKLIHFSYQKLTPGRFSTLLPPMFVSSSYTGASFITLKIIQEMNFAIQAILENKGSRSYIVSNPEQVIEFSFDLYAEIVEKIKFNQKDQDKIIRFYRILLLRLIILCMRQILAKGEKINPNTKDKFLNYIKRFTIVHELLQIIVKLIPNSLYNKPMNDFINLKLISKSDNSVKEMILKLPHSIFFDLKEFLRTKDLQFKTDWLLKSLSAFYYFLNDESLDEELCPFLDTVKEILDETQENAEYKSKFSEITRLFLMILAVSKYKDNVARHIVQIFTKDECKMLNFILKHKEFREFKQLDNLYSKYDVKEITETISFPLYLIPQQNVNFSTKILSDFDEYQIEKFSISDNDRLNVFLNEKKLSDEVKGPDIDIKVIGNNSFGHLQISSTKVVEKKRQNYSIFLVLISCILTKSINMCFQSEVDDFYDLSALGNCVRDDIFLKMIDLEDYEISKFDDEFFEFRKRFVHYFLPPRIRSFNEKAVNALFYIYMKILWISGFADLIIEDLQCYEDKKENKNKNQIVEVLKLIKPFVTKILSICQKENFEKEFGEFSKNAEELTSKQPPKKHNKEIINLAIRYIQSNKKSLSRIKSDSTELIRVKSDTKSATENIMQLLSKKYFSLARTFAIDLDFGKELDYEAFFDLLVDSGDEMQELIALKFINEDTKDKIVNIANDFVNEKTKIIRNAGIIVMSMFDKNKAIAVLSDQTKLVKQNNLSFEDQLKFIFNSAVENDQKVTDEVAKYIEQIRSDPKLVQNCINSVKDLDSSSLGAMICLGAEIFDTAVTGFCKVNNNIIQISELNQNNHNYKPSFRIDKPKFDVSDQLLNGLQAIANKMDLLTNQPFSVLQNMIICSFISYIYSFGQRKNDICQKIQNLYKNIVEITSARDVTMGPDDLYRKIREMKRFLTVKSSNVKFIPINISLQSEKDKTSVFSIFPTPIQPNKAFKFNLKPRNTLKYIGLIDTHYNVCFLSVFNKFIFLKNKYFKFVGDSFNFTLAFKNSRAYFDDIEVQTELFDPCFVFQLTVADDNSINYQIIDFKQNKIVKPKLFDHNFDLSVLFPKKCIGMNVKIDGYDNAFISDIKSDNLYEVTASSNSKIDTLLLSCYKLSPQNTDLEDILTRSAFATKIGFNAEEIKNQFIDLTKSATYSLLKPIVSNNLSDVFVPQLIRLDLNLDVNSGQIQELVKMMQPKLNEITQKINTKLRENEQNPNIRNESDLRRLMNDPNNSIQLAYYNWWRIFERNNSTIVKYFLDFKKSSDYLLGHYLTHYNFDNVNYVDFLDFFEKPFFNNQQNISLVKLEIRQKIVDYVEKLLKEKSDIFFKIENHSLLIKNICEQELVNILQHKENITPDSFKAIFLYANIKQNKMRNIQQNFYSFYPCNVLTNNGSECILQPNQHRNDVRMFSYSFNRGNVLNEWKQFKAIKDLKPLYQRIAESRVYHIPLMQDCQFNSLSIYLIDVIFARPGFEIPSSAIQINDKINGVLSSINYPCQPEYWPQIEFNQIVPQNPEQCFIYSFMRIRNQFRTMCSNDRFYTCTCADFNFIDAGGPFRESLTSMVEELMDLRFRFFIQPPDSLVCERETRVPSISLNQELANSIGAAIAACAITKNPRNWLLPEFMWDYLVDSSGRNLNAFVDCTDPNYFNSLAAVCANIKNGFDLVFEPNLRNALCGYILKVMAVGSAINVDQFGDLLMCDDKRLIACFKQAFSLMTTVELETIFRFFTGTNRLSNSSRKYRIKLVSTKDQNEDNYPLISAHTCTWEADVAGFTNPEKLKAKLLKSAEYCPNIVD